MAHASAENDRCPPISGAIFDLVSTTSDESYNLAFELVKNGRNGWPQIDRNGLLMVAPFALVGGTKTLNRDYGELSIDVRQQTNYRSLKDK
jgi:hypothetical protein